MSRTNHICLMAKYNEWMNAKLYEAVMGLPEEELVANKNAPFGSILGILNHLIIGDIIWLKRFATHPANYLVLKSICDLPTPTSLDQVLFTDIHGLSNQRKLLDQIITEWGHTVSERDLDHPLSYTNTKGVVASKNFFSLVTHLFNHQTHHRGQVTTLLWQSNVDMGITDLVALIPDEPVA
ncbi:MAG: DinB family protein [Gallionella sp.]